MIQINHLATQPPNAIIQAALHGVSTDRATIYVTHQPCLVCAKMIINAGIRRVVYSGDYPDDVAQQFLEEAGVALVCWRAQDPPLPGQMQGPRIPGRAQGPPLR
jgi:deoxycytidylate deaminase